MTKLRAPASKEAKTMSLASKPNRAERMRILRRGLGVLALGAALTCLAVTWSNGPLGLLSLITVFGALVWTSLRLMQNWGARFRPQPASPSHP